MTAHLYTDGKYRMDLRIKHRVTLEDLACILVTTEATYGDDELPTLTARETQKRIREALEWHGMDVRVDWSGDMDDDETTTAIEWAREQVARAYPELAAKEL